MKAILISIQPKWVEKIASGEKTIEVRKSLPNIERPFKCYIYCTKGKDLLREVDWCNTRAGIHKTNYKIINLDYCTNKIANGKVIGEFVCDRIDDYIYKGTDNQLYWRYPDTRDVERVKKESCLTIGEIIDYIGDSDNCCFWHISDLVIYDKPKELCEFTPICKVKGEWCDNCICYEETFGGCCRVLSRPPQSWCYVEDQEDERD